MTPLPAVLDGKTEMVAWRLDRRAQAARWNSGAGAKAVGGRWNSVGQAAVYCSLDPATTILEKAVHTGFAALDEVPHVLTAIEITDVAAVHVLHPQQIPQATWLRPGSPGTDQQRFGDTLLAKHPIVVLPSVVSRFSWNLIFDPQQATGCFSVKSQQAFILDPRLPRR
jgi:RES domain-containing protein